MKNCTNCGAQLNDDATFCTACGHAQTTNGTQPHANSAQPAANPVRTLLRAMGNGPLFLTGTVAYTAALLFQLVGAFLPGNGLGGTVYTLMNAMPSDMMYYAEDYGIDVNDALNTAQNGSFTATLLPTLLMLLPVILTAVALWLVFVAVRDTTAKPIGTAGFTIIKVLTIIGIVAQAIALLVTEIGTGMFAKFIDTYSSDGSIMPVMIVMMVLVAIGFALAILYNVQLVRTLDSMAETSRTLTPCGNASTYVAVIGFIGATFLLLGCLLAGGVFDKLNLLALAVSQVAFGVLLLNYRGQMKTLRVGQHA